MVATENISMLPDERPHDPPHPDDDDENANDHHKLEKDQYGRDAVTRMLLEGGDDDDDGTGGGGGRPTILEMGMDDDNAPTSIVAC